MKVIIVGCGAIGQVFGLHLQKAGVELGCYDRPAVTEKLKGALAQGGMLLYQVSRSHRREPLTHRLANYQVLTDVAECQQFKPDVIWFTVPSPVYHSEWFGEFLQKVPSERVVCFAPEGGRPELIPDNTNQDRMVFAGITFMAWQADLEENRGRPEGVYFWRPPLGIPLTGTKTACRAVVQLLKQAGFRATMGKPGSPAQGAVTAVMTAFVAGLELSGWTLRGFRNSPWLQRAARASREGVLSQLTRAGIFTKTMLGILCSRVIFSIVTRLLPLLFPFNLEKYLKFHYTKTREQSLTLLDVFAQDGKRRGLPVENIQLLLQALRDST